jgi:YbbR domain-containing protein
MRRFLTENMLLKAASLILAIALWSFVSSRGRSTIPIEVPVGFNNIPNDMVIEKFEPKTVTLRIEGHERVVRNLTPSDVPLFLDLSGAKERENLIPVDIKDLRVPKLLTVTDIEPSTVAVYLEKKLSKTVSVNASVIGLPKKGFEISFMEVLPKDIVSEGARSEMRMLGSLHTEPVDITGASDTVVAKIRVDKGGKEIMIDPEEVIVRVVITRKGK